MKKCPLCGAELKNEIDNDGLPCLVCPNEDYYEEISFNDTGKCQCGAILDRNGNCPQDQQLVEGY